MNIKLNRALKGLVLNNLDFALTRCARDTQHDQLAKFFARARPMTTEHPLIRVGNANDGGYLLPDDLSGIRTCYSPGVSTMADFELALTRRGIRCLLADWSVDAAPVSDPLISFEKRFLGAEDNEIFMTLPSWLARTSNLHDDEQLLQMDIEGSEYDVLIDTPAAVLRRFRIMVIEFHSLEALFTPMGFRLINGVFAKVLRDFTLVHAHPNNCFEWQSYGGYKVPTVMEFTFLRHDRIQSRTPTTQFPHPLDRTNVPGNKDFALPECWYEAGPAVARSA